MREIFLLSLKAKFCFYRAGPPSLHICICIMRCNVTFDGITHICHFNPEQTATNLVVMKVHIVFKWGDETHSLYSCKRGKFQKRCLLQSLVKISTRLVFKSWYQIKDYLRGTFTSVFLPRKLQTNNGRLCFNWQMRSINNHFPRLTFSPFVLCLAS